MFEIAPMNMFRRRVCEDAHRLCIVAAYFRLQWGCRLGGCACSRGQPHLFGVFAADD